IEHALDRRLQPPRHGDVVGPDAPAVLGELALEIEHMSRPRRREDDAPETGVGGEVVAIGWAEPDERVLARHDHDIGVCGAHRFSLLQYSQKLAFGAHWGNRKPLYAACGRRIWS